MRISDWSSDVCSSDLEWVAAAHATLALRVVHHIRTTASHSTPSSIPSRSQSSRDVPVSVTSGGQEAVQELQRQNIEQRRERALHENQSPEQIARHRARNVNAQMPKHRVVRHRLLTLQDRKHVV